MSALVEDESLLEHEKTWESYSGKHYNEQGFNTVDRHLPQVPFIKPVQILEFDGTGAIFTGFDEIKVEIPPNSISPGIKAYLQIGVCLYGPFVFKENYRLISPVLWLCLKEALTLRKPIKITLPHILSEGSEKELAVLGVGFAKASHDYVIGKQTFVFQPSYEVSHYYSSEGKGYGVIETDHFCFYCLQANKDRSVTQNASYCLSRVESPNTCKLQFYVTYFFETCLKVSELDKN